jgi:hypothetical protein
MQIGQVLKQYLKAISIAYLVNSLHYISPSVISLVVTVTLNVSSCRKIYPQATLDALLVHISHY